MCVKVSVVVPVYNGEEYIEKCCQSLQKQTLTEIQIIFVNDGSNDKTAELLNSCQSQYPNVTALHQENKGVSAARNLGIQKCTGEYIGFVDVDDMIDEDMYETLYTKACENNFDVICMDRIGAPGEITVFGKQKEWVSALFQADISMSACNKLFKKSLLQAPVFPEGKRIHEDLYAVYTAFTNATKVGCINIEKYHYIHHEGSSSRAPVFAEKYFDAIEIANQIYDDARIKFPDLKDEADAYKAKTYLRISKIYYLRKAPREYRDRIAEMKQYLRSLPKDKLRIYYSRNDMIRYYLYLYAFPLFMLLIKTIDRI